MADDHWENNGGDVCGSKKRAIQVIVRCLIVMKSNVELADIYLWRLNSMTTHKENITENSKSESKASSKSARSKAKAHLLKPKGEPRLMKIGSLRRDFLLLPIKASEWVFPPQVNP